MALNKKDFVIVNGKRYYADGGNINAEIPPDEARLVMFNYGRDNKGYPIENWGKRTRTTRGTIRKSQDYGNENFKNIPPDIQAKINENKVLWANFLGKHYDKKVLSRLGIDLDKFVKDNDWNSENAERVAGLMQQWFPNKIKSNDPVNGITDNTRIRWGDNLFYSLASSSLSNNISEYIKDDWDKLKKVGLGIYERQNPNDDRTWWSMRKDKDNNRHYFFYDIDDEGRTKRAPIYVMVDKDNMLHQYSRTAGDFGNGQYRQLNEGDDATAKGYEYDLRDNDKQPYYVVNGNSSSLSLGNKVDAVEKYYNPQENINQNAQGGRLNRYYADGGAMGQIPLGEQMPEDYNMVGEGGMHEENPMGGVPYGINQDGSQNMVEEGEVSVGDNVFSNRSQLSPELCQQLGLPEGTTPAEAMQQIEQLYEQGQISEEEFNEVQQIIFQDQEQQKQNEPSSYQQGQVGGQGVPMPQNEGIDPSMIQGAPMNQQQMDPSMMQNEGIDPSMFGQQMAYGGYRW